MRKNPEAPRYQVTQQYGAARSRSAVTSFYQCPLSIAMVIVTTLSRSRARSSTLTPKVSPHAPATLLCVSTFPADTGFAWRFIRRLWCGLAAEGKARGVRTVVAFPSADLEGENGEYGVVELDATCRSLDSVIRTAAFVRDYRVKWIYLTDLPPVHWSYPIFRLMGAGRIVVHDHTSGSRTAPRGPRLWAKWLLARIPGLSADLIIAVSDYVVKRHLEVTRIPPHRVKRVWNGVELVDRHPHPEAIHGELGTDSSRPIVTCASRMTVEKGIRELLVGFDQMLTEWPPASPLPLLILVGDGPELASLKVFARDLPSAQSIYFVGYSDDPMRYFASSTLCVHPSVWQEAFGLSVLEPMAAGRAVVATAVGGVPEIIQHGVTGLLVPPRDPDALATAMRMLLLDGAKRTAMASAAQRRAREIFALSKTIGEVAAAVFNDLPAQE